MLTSASICTSHRQKSGHATGRSAEGTNPCWDLRAVLSRKRFTRAASYGPLGYTTAGAYTGNFVPSDRGWRGPSGAFPAELHWQPLCGRFGITIWPSVHWPLCGDLCWHFIKNFI